MSDGLSRRSLIRGAGALAAGATLSPMARAFEHPMFHAKQASANDKLVIGLIGCGGMGAANMRNLMNYADVEIAALCDVDSNRIPGDFKTVEDKYKRKPDVYEDYRKMLDRKDIDAVIIGSPDHWHALQLIHACQAGKDSFCEKPLSHHLTESVAMAKAVEKYNRISQVGTWQRSTKEFTDAIDYVRTGKLGKVKVCRSWITDGFRAGRETTKPVPSGFNYDMWVGPAPFLPYQSNRVHWNWRWFMNFGGGMTTDWGVHMMDIALLGMSKDQDLPMPSEVTAYGGLWDITNDDRTAPDTTEALYKFDDPEFVMSWSIRRDHPGLPGHGTEFVSSDGRTLRVWRGGWKVMDADGKDLEKPSAGDPPNHWRDFVDCVKTRSKPRADLRSVAQTTIVCHLANVAMQSGQTVKWDDKKQDLVGSVGKNTEAYKRAYRKAYPMPKI